MAGGPCRPPSGPLGSLTPPLTLLHAHSGLDQCSQVLFAGPSCPVIAQPRALGAEHINSGPLNCISPARARPRPLCSSGPPPLLTLPSCFVWQTQNARPSGGSFSSFTASTWKRPEAQIPGNTSRARPEWTSCSPLPCGVRPGGPLGQWAGRGLGDLLVRVGVGWCKLPHRVTSDALGIRTSCRHRHSLWKSGALQGPPCFAFVF